MQGMIQVVFAPQLKFKDTKVQPFKNFLTQLKTEG
jgi:hypothetical protein